MPIRITVTSVPAPGEVEGDMPTCKGAWSLGTACQQCTKCFEEAPNWIRHLQTRLNEERSKLVSIWNARKAIELSELRYRKSSASGRVGTGQAVQLQVGDMSFDGVLDESVIRILLKDQLRTEMDILTDDIKKLGIDPDAMPPD